MGRPSKECEYEVLENQRLLETGMSALGMGFYYRATPCTEPFRSWEDVLRSKVPCSKNDLRF